MPQQHAPNRQPQRTCRPMSRRHAARGPRAGGETYERPAAGAGADLTLAASGAPRTRCSSAAGRYAEPLGAPGGTRPALAARFIAMTFLVSALSACDSATATPTPQPTATSTATLTLTPSATPTPTPTPTPTFPADAVVAIEQLNLRAGPDTLHPIVGGLGAATAVAIDGRNHDGSWYAVHLPDERHGWISADYVDLRRAVGSIPIMPTPSPPPTPTPTAVPMSSSRPLIVWPPTVAQGDPLLVRLRDGNPDAKHVIATLGETTASMTQVDHGVYAALIAAGIDLPPGEHEAYTTTVSPNGDTWSESVKLRVADAGYPEEELSFDQQTAGLLDPDLREAELQRLHEVWSHVTREKLWQGHWTRPVTGTVSSPFGSLRSYGGPHPTSRHTGTDFRASTGTSVLAAARGRVALAEGLTARGNVVWLDHGWGVYSGYFHLSSIAVETDQLVEPGHVLGAAGATGLTTGPHLHWEVRVQGVAVNPVQFLLRDVGAEP